MSLPEPGPATSAAEITRRARSNLAFALASLPAERRRDMITFYAFCRVADDIADDDSRSAHERRAHLAAWRTAVLQSGSPTPAADRTTTEPLLAEVIALIPKYGIDPALLADILDGVATDLDRTRFATYAELLHYCYQVASAVGLVSIRIFGHRHDSARDYALQMGYALQLTNIIRDVGQDARDNGRIYLPLEDLQRFGVTEQQILEQRYDDRFRALMEHQYERAKACYQKADDVLHPEDRKAMIAAEMMGQIYYEILEKIKARDYRVFDKRIGLHPARKGLILLAYLLRSLIGAI